MTEKLKYLCTGAVPVLLLIAIAAFTFQPSGTQQQAAAQVREHRFIIVGADQPLPVLLDTHTGRTWYRQLVREGGLVWTPITVNPADTSRYHYEPLQAAR